MKSAVSRTVPTLKELQPPILIACHDAGATNLIIGWLKEQTEIPPLLVVAEGPARNLWQVHFPTTLFTTLEDSLAIAGCLLSGSGWASDVEHNARYQAREMGIHSIAVLDHWINYRERFVRNGKQCLPNAIWVADSYALEIASAEFFELPVQLFENVYLTRQAESVENLTRLRRPNKQRHVLYALEPIRTKWTSADPRPGEFQALDYFISQLLALGLDDDTEIRLRPHPSDPPKKYDDWLNTQNSHNVALAPQESIAEAVAWSDWVVGCESFALVIGIASGRKTISTLPPWGHQCRLPHSELLHLRLLEHSK